MKKEPVPRRHSRQNLVEYMWNTHLKISIGLKATTDKAIKLLMNASPCAPSEGDKLTADPRSLVVSQVTR